MTLSRLKAKKPSSILGVDASTMSFAFGLIRDDKPVRWGIIKYTGKDRYQRALDSYHKVSSLFEEIGHIDYILQEQAVGSINQKTGLFLAQSYGATMPILLSNCDKYDMVNPNEWQAALGQKIMTPTQIKKQWPDQKAHFYTEKARELRKQRNLDWVRENLGIDLPYEANDVGDALAISAYAAGLV